MTTDFQIPSLSDITSRLQVLSQAELRSLSDTAQIPFGTLWQLQRGATRDPRLETVRKLWPHLIRAVPDPSATNSRTSSASR